MMNSEENDALQSSGESQVMVLKSEKAERTNEVNVEKDCSRSQKEPEISLSDKVENGKNKHLVRCQFCPSHILNPGLGVYIQNEFELPLMTKEKKLPETEGEVKDKTKYEMLNYFWQINDMYTFENICFSNKVGNIKYLACADCEIGPVGYHNLDTEISYIALARVHHVN